MIGVPLVADEEALVVVGPRRLVDRRGALHALVHRQVADVVLVELQPHLVRERQRVEFARGRERGVDHRLRHAVAGHVEEADLLARAPDLRRRGIESAGLSPEGGPEVDDGNRPRRLLDAPDRHGFEDIHSG
jgi:hypothetical protein